MRTLIILISLVFISAVSVSAQESTSIKVADTVEKYFKSKDFSGTILVAEEGTPIFYRSYGTANHTTQEAIKNDYHYSVASVTKLFTGIRTLQLVEAGKLELHKPLITYLPEYQKLISEEVTAHHLLLHISGLPQELDAIYRNPGKTEEIVSTILQENQPNILGVFYYNNVDYFLLGLLIEKLSGQSWESEITEYILKPLGMEQTGFLRYGNYPSDFAYSYSAEGDALVQDPLFHIENYYAAGNMYSTASDLLRLDQALYSDILLSEEKKTLLSQSYPEYNYVGYSVWNYNYPFAEGQPKVMERRGGILGANVVLMRLPESNYTIIILSNNDRFNPDSFGDPENLREMLLRTLY